jgi:DNA-binding SARP family transcriptional activator/WD40 repeat protein/energy-coupling factor transporter ATP-binding protein EcfA2
MAAITVLGPVAVDDGGPALSPRDRKVLAVLVARRHQEVSSEALAEALWGDDVPASWGKVVQGCIARLRRRLGAESIVTGRGGYRLAVPAEDVDAGRFERLVSRARELVALGHSDQAAYAADEALALWHGTALADLEDWEPGRGEAIRLGELRLLVEELRMTALLAAGRHGEVLAEAALRVREQPLRERRWALLARAQYQDGRQGEALATLRRARKVLTEELGLDPGRELVELERAVLQQDPALAVPEARLASAGCPWPGLAAYDVEDADSFFGRAEELHECVQRLARTGFLAVVGPSGSGKSSLVRAGLAAHLRAEARSVAVIVPAPRPVDALAAVVRSRGTPVLVVDQFEELFTAGVTEQTRAEFLATLVEQVGLRPVVVTLRADRLGELATYPDVARLVEDGLYLLKTMGRAGLCAAIEQPARRAGLLLEQGLVDLLVRDVEGEPGSLPMLAHALRETWERRVGHTLTVEAYRSSGGIQGAVAQSAEKVYEDASQSQRLAMREMLLRMVHADPAGDPVRTSVPRDVLIADPEHEDLLERLVHARLVTAEQDRVGIAHEALARAWPRLQSWLVDDVEGERIRHHLAATAEAWQAMGRPDSELYRGARLAATREWWERGTHQLSHVEQDFLDGSQSAHNSTLARLEDQTRQQRRTNRRLRLLVAGAAVLALLAAGFGGVARVQWQHSQEAGVALASQVNRTRAHELSASALAELGTDPALAKTLAVVAAQTAPHSLQTTGALHRAYAADPVVSRISMNHKTGRLQAVLHPDGTRVAMSAESVFEPSLALEVHDARTGDLLWEWVRPDEPGYESAVLAGAVYSADGSVLASGVAWDPTGRTRLGPPVEASSPAEGALGIHLWDGSTHEPLGVIDVGPCGGWPLEISKDVVLVRTLVPSTDPSLATEKDHPVVNECRWFDGGVGNYLVDRDTGKMILAGVTNLGLTWNLGFALSEDGSVAAVRDQPADDFTLGDRGDVEATRILDTGTGAELARFEGAVPFDLDPTGERILVKDSAPYPTNEQVTTTWKVLAVPGGRTLVEFGGQGATSYGAFGPGGDTVLTTGRDNVLLVWDAHTGQQLHRVAATGSGRLSGAGDRWILVTRMEAGGAVLVDTQPRGEGWAVDSCGGHAAMDQLRIAGDRVVVGRDCSGSQGQLDLFDLDGGRLTVPAAHASYALDVSPDGTLFVSQANTAPLGDGPPIIGPLQVRDVATGKVSVTLEHICEHTRWQANATGCGYLSKVPFSFDAARVRWSPDGRWIAGSEGYSVAVWDAKTGELVSTLFGEESPEVTRWAPVWDLIFSPDSAHLLLTTSLWNRSGRSNIVTIDTSTWAPVLSQNLGDDNSWSGLIGFAADGSLVAVTPWHNNVTDTDVLLIDPETLTISTVWPRLVDGLVSSAAISPDGARIAMATHEGFAGVWDLSTGALVDRATPGLGRLQGVQWRDDQDLFIMSAGGAVVEFTTDPDRLLAQVRDSLTRGISESECVDYAITPCPGLADLRGGPPTVPPELRGLYDVSWTAQDLESAVVSHYEAAFGAALDPASLEQIGRFTVEREGVYRLELTEDAYVIEREGAVWCRGPVMHSDQRPDRLLLGVDSGPGCATDFHYAEIGWDLAGDALSLPHEEFRGDAFDALIWGAKPLERLEEAPGGAAGVP